MDVNLPMDGSRMEQGTTFMRHIRIEYAVGVVTLMWSLLSVFVSQPMVHELSSIMPAASWTFSGFVIGVAQIYISRNPDKLIGTFWHWCVAFVSTIFWCHMGVAANSIDAGAVPVLIYWATAAATLWELGHVRS